MMLNEVCVGGGGRRKVGAGEGRVTDLSIPVTAREPQAPKVLACVPARGAGGGGGEEGAAVAGEAVAEPTSSGHDHQPPCSEGHPAVRDRDRTLGSCP